MEVRALEHTSSPARRRHDVFVSYARENTQQARAIVEILELEGYEVYWDQQFHAIVPWDRQIERAIDRARLAVIVLWSRASLNSNMVREEVHRACKQKGLLLSVRIEDVEPPFPHALKQAIELQTIDPESVGRLLDELDGRQRRHGNDSAPPRSKPPPSSVAPVDRPAFLLRAGGVATVVLTAVFLLFGTGLLDQLFSTDTKLRFVSVWARSVLLPPLPESPVTYVAIGAETLKRLGRFGAGYRARHATILDAAVQHGAKVVAFDVYFPPPREPPANSAVASTPEDGTDTFAKAITAARVAGTAVVIGEEARGQTDARIRSALQRGPRAVGTIATLCIGLRSGFAVSAPLFVASNQDSRLEVPVPSLSMASFASFVNADPARAILSADRSKLELPQDATLTPLSVTLSELDPIRPSQVGACAFFSGRSEIAGTMVIDVPPASRYDGGLHVVEYATLFADIAVPQGNDEDARKAATRLDLQLKGRLVLIAPRLPNSDCYPVFGWNGGYAWGSELHAYAIETLLSGRGLRIIPNSAHLMLMGVLGALGAFVRLYYRRSRRWRRAGLLILLGTNVIGVVSAAVYFNLLVDGVYQTLAIILMYLMCGRYVSPWSSLIAAKGQA